MKNSSIIVTTAVAIAAEVTSIYLLSFCRPSMRRILGMKNDRAAQALMSVAETVKVVLQ